jgi:hypothetical protein
MMRLLLVMALSLTVVPTIVSAAQDGPRAQSHLGTAQQQRACRPDVLRHCRGMEDKDDYTLANCLRANVRRLTAPCRQALEGARD